MADCEARHSDTQDFCVSVDGTVAVCRVRLDTAFRMVTVEAHAPILDATLALLLEVAERHARAMDMVWIRFLRFSRTDLPSRALYGRMGFRCSRFGVAGSDIVVYEVAKRLAERPSVVRL